ncbi:MULTISPECIES: dicarboxylate/amino acid:cation symporter [unclassified Methylophilus]|uniref:dicarboxylate/amino acid:cation symporter n=1 Tax=unclassified Methylophilus TaxID=2630143 RepID=UPI0023B21CEE|nr:MULTISPECIES: dicarboxylate/amino acid:cation symporter [unclassified Methylophilus]MDF0377976.1 cation:dicarboxylase symporter family transporter [Methylophilus sp. YYY-1]MDT7849345.1 dicarboxylate/amino acid:cation symporter [Methylophilus sp. VKM B-3414]
MSKLGLNGQILLAVVVAVTLGLFAQGKAPEGVLYAANLVGTLFIDLLKMVMIPLVFCAIVTGIANLRQHRQIDVVWKTTLLFFATTTIIAVVIGLTASHLFKPGAGLHLEMFSHAMQQFESRQMSLPEFFTQFLHGIFMNPFKALAEGNILAIVAYAMCLGIALVMASERYPQWLALFEEGMGLSMQMIGWIMRLAPWGIAALLFKLVATQDVSLFASLTKFMLVVTGTTLFHGVIVLPVLLFLFTGKHPVWFLRQAREALVTAFATSSSNATMPVTMRCATQNMHVKPEIAGFVVPLGATMNMDGTALYEAAAALFVAQLAGIDLSLGQQLVVCLTTMIAAMGAPGIPSAGMVTMVMVLQSVGLPAEAIAILLPIDRLLDTVRTAVNVEGDMIGSLVVQHRIEKLAQ